MSVRIRLAREDDAPAVAVIYAPSVESTPISFETVAPTAAEMSRRIGEITAAYPWLVCELDDRLAGYAYATTHRTRSAYRWSVDAAVYVDARYRRRGVGRGLYLSLFAILRAQRFVNAYAGITLPNHASVGLHESVGFQPVGVYRRVGFKLGAWHDVGWWQLTLRLHPPAPEEPLPLSVVEARSDWAAILASGVPALRVRP